MRSNVDPAEHCFEPYVAVLGIRIRKIRMFLGLQDPDPDPLVRGTDPDPSLL
jgi:hypothetical protein